jgi:hypothetical protein
MKYTAAVKIELLDGINITERYKYYSICPTILITARLITRQLITKL